MVLGIGRVIITVAWKNNLLWTSSTRVGSSLLRSSCVLPSKFGGKVDRAYRQFQLLVQVKFMSIRVGFSVRLVCNSAMISSELDCA